MCRRNIVLLVGLVIAVVVGILIFSKRSRETKRRQLQREKFTEANAFETDKKKRKKINNHIGLKFQMYIISLCFLFALAMIININEPSWKEIMNMENVKVKLWLIFKCNIASTFCFIMTIVSYIMYKFFQCKFKGSSELPVQVKEVKSENYEYLTFLTTYIIPLICFDLSELKNVIVFILLLIIIGIIFVKSDFYLGNPTLALMQYKLYRVRLIVGNDEKEKLIVTKDTIQVNDYIECINFDDSTCYARRNAN